MQDVQLEHRHHQPSHRIFRLRLLANDIESPANVGSLFRLADALAFLHEGRILEHGSPEQFRASERPEVQAFLRRYLERERLREQAEPAAVLDARREPPPAHAR